MRRDNIAGSLCCIGDIVLDRYTDGTYIGGCAANVAIYAAHSGILTTLFSSVGDDYGQEILSRLDNTSNLQAFLTLHNGTTATINVETKNGERRFFNFSQGVMPKIMESITEIDFSSYDLIFSPIMKGLGNVATVITEYVQRDYLAFQLSHHSIPEHCMGLTRPDLSSLIAQAARRASLLIVGADKEELPTLPEDTQSEETIIIVTRGSDGVYVYKHGRLIARKAASTSNQVIDTNGCGDAFAGAFLAKWVRTHDLNLALSSGSRSAYSAMMYKGPNMLGCLIL